MSNANVNSHGIAVVIPVGLLQPNPWNPQYETDEEFAALVESVRQTGGLVEPVVVRPMGQWPVNKDLVTATDQQGKPYVRYNGNQQFQIVHGEHRYRACLRLNITDVPCFVIEADDDLARFLTVRLNRLHGKLDPTRLVALISQLTKSYRREYIAKQLGFLREEALESFLAKVKGALPPGARERFAKAAKDVESIAGLSDLIHKIFNESGETTKRSYLAFAYGGKTHILVYMNERLKDLMFQLVAHCDEHQLDLAEELAERLASATREQQQDRALTPPKDLNRVVGAAVETDVTAAPVAVAQEVHAGHHNKAPTAAANATPSHQQTTTYGSGTKRQRRRTSKRTA